MSVRGVIFDLDGTLVDSSRDIAAARAEAKRLVEAAKAKPGTINYGSSGVYGTLHVAMEMFADRAQIVSMDLVEVNEAFSAQYVAVEKELGLDRARTNIHGGAIAIGHPLAASGTRISLHLLHALRKLGKRYGLGSACIGGGQGAAVIVEAFPA